jgi:hypothetical protein
MYSMANYAGEAQSVESIFQNSLYPDRTNFETYFPVTVPSCESKIIANYATPPSPPAKDAAALLLSELSVSPGVMQPNFAQETYTYYVVVQNSVDAVTITAAPQTNTSTGRRSAPVLLSV